MASSPIPDRAASGLIPEPAAEPTAVALPRAPMTAPDGTVPFVGTVPPGDVLIGVWTEGRTVETLFVIAQSAARQFRLIHEGRAIEHVSTGPDGRWQYEDPEGR